MLPRRPKELIEWPATSRSGAAPVCSLQWALCVPPANSGEIPTGGDGQGFISGRDMVTRQVREGICRYCHRPDGPARISVTPRSTQLIGRAALPESGDKIAELAATIDAASARGRLRIHLPVQLTMQAGSHQGVARYVTCTRALSAARSRHWKGETLWGIETASWLCIGTRRPVCTPVCRLTSPIGAPCLVPRLGPNPLASRQMPVLWHRMSLRC